MPCRVTPGCVVCMSVVVGLSDDQIWSLGFEFLRSCNDSGADRNDWLTTFREDFRALGDFMVPGDTPSLVVPSRLDIDASQSMVAAGERGRVGGQLAIGVVVCLSDRAVFTGTVGVVRAKRHSLVIPYDTIRDVYLIEYLEHGRNVPALEVLADRRWGLLSLPKFDQTRDLGLLLNTLNGVTVPHWGNFNCDGELLDARGPSRCPECGNVHNGVIAWTEADREPSGAPGGSPEQEHPSHTTQSTATRCESCNAEIDSGDRFCHSCGTGLAEPEETAVVSAAADPLRLDRDSERAAGIVEQVKDLDAERLKRIVDRQRELPPRSESLDAANELATREEAAACAFCFRRIRDILTENRLEGTSVSDEVVVAEAGRNAALAYLLGDRLDEPDRRSLLEPWLVAVGEPPTTGDLVELALQDKNSQRADGSDQKSATSPRDPTVRRRAQDDLPSASTQSPSSSRIPSKRSPTRTLVVAAIGIALLAVPLILLLTRSSDQGDRPEGLVDVLERVPALIQGGSDISEQGDSVTVVDIAAARRDAGLAAADPDATPAEKERYWQELFGADLNTSVRASVSQLLTAEPDALEAELGISLMQITQFAELKVRSGFVDVLLGAFDADSVDAAVRSDTTWADALEVIEYRGLTYYSWGEDFEIDVARSSDIRPLGLSARLFVSEEQGVVYWAQSTANMEAAIDALIFEGSTLAEDEYFAPIAAALDDAGVYSAFLSPAVSGYDAEGIMGAGGRTWDGPLLLPYEAFAVGGSRVDGESHLVIVFANLDGLVAEANEERLDRIVTEGESAVDGTAWSDHIGKGTVQARGPLTIGDFTVDDPRIGEYAFFRRDSLYVTELDSSDRGVGG